MNQQVIFRHTIGLRVGWGLTFLVSHSPKWLHTIEGSLISENKYFNKPLIFFFIGYFCYNFLSQLVNNCFSINFHVIHTSGIQGSQFSAQIFLDKFDYFIL